MELLNRELIVAIDGPSGAGKSTISKLLAKTLGYINIDTGAMYRAVALAAKRANISPANEVALGELCRALQIEFVQSESGEKILLNGEDVSSAIRTPEVSLLTSEVAACPSVRKCMVVFQRKMASQGGVVLEGRDIGTVVFPDAEVKFFLVASARERGRRRYEELKAKGLNVDLEQTISEVEARDAADQAREHSPLAKAEDAILVDSTAMDIDQVLEKMLCEVQKRRNITFVG